jgi:hypothetical protein
MSTLAIQVDNSISDRFLTASESEKTRWESAFNLWWKVYFTENSNEKLDVVVDYFRQKAVERGLTEAELKQILK